MKKSLFSDVLDAAESLPLVAKEELAEILHKRATEERRSELAKDIKNARSEYRRGRCKALSSDEIMNEVLS